MAAFGCVGISYRKANAALRDRVFFTDETAAAFLDALAVLGVDQAMALSTCNRCEVFFWGDERAQARVFGAYAAWFPDARDLVFALEARHGDAALAYLFRVAAGLESMILGEYQILGQVKEAYGAAQRRGRVGKHLDRILRDALTAAKRVKTELDLGAVPPSVCRAGIDLVERNVGFAGKRVFVIGSGKTGSLAAHLARERGALGLAVCNRSPERARRLEAECGATIVDYACRYGAIAESDIVISATASPHVVVKADLVSLTHPVSFLDLASPRDVDEALRENPLATLASIDSIGALAAGDRDERARLTAQAMAILSSAVAETSAWLAHDAARKDVAP